MKLSQSRAYIVNDDGNVVAATDVWAEVERLRAALGEAAMSMETMANAAGSRDGLLLEMSQVRGYARSRAAVARAALRGEGEK